MCAKLKIKLKFIVFFLVFSLFLSNAQNFNSLKDYFSAPVEIPIYLSGNFGELRGNHFHSGIDIKTQGTIGHKIMAVADGYVYRIKIQVNGYGKALYIRHTNGYISVYGHLHKFNEEINNYVLSEQYKRQTHAIELFPAVGKLPVKQGDLIAFSGNTGGSSGPHLHFEIRDKYERPVNPLLLDFPINDNIAPDVETIALYPLTNTSFVNGKSDVLFVRPVKKNGIYYLPYNPIEISGKLGIGVEVFDYLDGSRNKCGIQSLEIMVDGEQHYVHDMSRFSFSESRYINSHIDYAEKKKNKRSIQKTFLDPNNPLSIYKNVINKGAISFNDTLVHTIEINIADAHNNVSKVSFEVNNKRPSVLTLPTSDTLGKMMHHDKQNTFVKNDISVDIQAYSLYNDINFRYAKLPTDKTPYSDLHMVHHSLTPVHKRYMLKIRAVDLPENLRPKALIAEIDDGKIYSMGGEWENGYVTTSIRNFGDFIVTVDTIAPTLKHVFAKGANMQNYKSYRLYASDNLTGIKTYNGYIDDKWVLFEYDPKINTLNYNFEDNAIERNKMHTLKIFVTDHKSNNSELSSEFYW